MFLPILYNPPPLTIPLYTCLLSTTYFLTLYQIHANSKLFALSPHSIPCTCLLKTKYLPIPHYVPLYNSMYLPTMLCTSLHYYLLPYNTTYLCAEYYLPLCLVLCIYIQYFILPYSVPCTSSQY